MVPPTCAPIPYRTVLSLAGVHATQFLNGLLSLGPPAPPRGGFFTAFLHAQGRVLYDAFVYRQHGAEDEYLIEYDSRTSAAPPLISLLKRYVLRSKVRVKDVSGEWDVWAAWGGENVEDDRKWRWGRSGAVEPVWNVQKWPWGGEDGRSILDRRAHGMGKRLLVQKGHRPLEAGHHDIAPAEKYTIHRMLHGVPDGITDIPPVQAFPMESNLDAMGAIDFHKGCYVGQELTIRTYHTGVIRKRIYPVKVHPPTDAVTPPVLQPGLDIRPVAAGGDIPRPRGTGKLLSSVGDIGLALLRLEHVESVNRGLASFVLEIVAEGGARQSWPVTHSLPAGWPTKGVNEVD